MRFMAQSSTKNVQQPSRITPLQCTGKIVSRDVPCTATNVPIYTVLIDKDDEETIKDGVPLDDLFTYVTPTELERYEHEDQKREIAYEKAKLRARSDRLRQRMAIKRRLLARAEPQSASVANDHTLPADSDGQNSKLSRGRPRPSYSHLYAGSIEAPKRDAKPTPRAVSSRAFVSLPSLKSAGVASAPVSGTIPSNAVHDSGMADTSPQDQAKVSRNSDLGPSKDTKAIKASTEPSSYRKSLLGMIPDRRLSDSSDMSDDEDETFEIEDILAHQLSNPKTHGPQNGKKPVMLFKVKWVGWEEPTWEPKESFGEDLLQEYWMSVRDREIQK